MSRIVTIIKQAQRVTTENSPAILTAIGAVGVVTTAVLAAKGASKATRILDEVESEGGVLKAPIPRLMERTKQVWPCYVPAVATGAISITAIIMANQIGSKRTAAVMGAYTIAEKGFKEYQEKVVEQLGETKEGKVREAIIQDRMEKEPVQSRDVIITGGGESLCFDTLSGRYFQSTVENIRKAENDVNFQIINDMYASQNDFYRALDLPSIDPGEELGWNNTKRLEINFTSVLSTDNRPCLAMEYRYKPFPNYSKIW